MIYHNGWWHGNNASFIRLIQDSATIIVLGNKYNRGIYKANKLADIFGHYLTEKDDEESEAVKNPNTEAIKKPVAIAKRKATVRNKKVARATPVKKKVRKKS